MVPVLSFGRRRMAFARAANHGFERWRYEVVCDDNWQFLLRGNSFGGDYGIGIGGLL
jgi:hypothetical protein